MHQEEINLKVQFLLMQIEDRISRYREYRENNKWKATWFHMSVTLLGAITTVILGLDLADINIGFDWEKVSNNVALLFSAAITLISGYNTFFNHKQLWLIYTRVRNDLSVLKVDIEYYLEGNENLSEEIIVEFKERYTGIIENSNAEWFKLRMD